MLAEIIKEWVGYNGKEVEEKKPDGTRKKVKHHKIWAAAVTDTGHVYVRYGPAKQPLRLTEQIIRPRSGLSAHEAVSAAEQIFQEKVEEKLKKGYEAISFGVAPHYVPSFSRQRMSDEPETAIAPVTASEPKVADTLQSYLVALNQEVFDTPCAVCGTCHPRYLLDLGAEQTYTPGELLHLLQQDEAGQAWLAAESRRSEQTLQEVAGGVLCTMVENAPACPFPSLAKGSPSARG